MHLHACACSWEQVGDEGAHTQGCSSWGPDAPPSTVALGQVMVPLRLPPRAPVGHCCQHWGPSSRSQQECRRAEPVSQVWWPLPCSPQAF